MLCFFNRKKYSNTILISTKFYKISEKFENSTKFYKHIGLNQTQLSVGLAVTLERLPAVDENHLLSGQTYAGTNFISSP